MHHAFSTGCLCYLVTAPALYAERLVALRRNIWTSAGVGITLANRCRSSSYLVLTKKPGTILSLLPRWGLLGFVVVLNGCSSNLVREGPGPEDAETQIAVSLSPEDLLLKRLGSVAGGATVELSDGRSATAEPSYNAASGRVCRAVMVAVAGQGLDRRLACQADAGWVWQPYVLP